MKNINKRYRRNLRSNMAFYICMSFLTCMTVLMYLLFSSAVLSEEDYIDSFFKDNKIEDGQFTTFYNLPKNESVSVLGTDEKLPSIKELEEDFDISIEKQRYCNINGEDSNIRLFSPTKKINIPRITKGKAPEDSNELCLSQSYAEANDYEIGSKLELDGTEYSITGYFERPDYLYMIENQSDSYNRASEFGIGLVIKDRMDELEDADHYYSIRYGKDNQEKVRKHIDDKFITLSYMTSDTNHRISTPKSTITQFQMITGAILPALLVLVVAVIAVVLGRKVKSEVKQVGTLAALGYRKREIALHYAWYALLPGIAGEIIGLVVAFALVEPMGNAIFFKLEKLPVDYTIAPANIVPAMLLPIIAYFLTAVITVRRLLKRDVTEMLIGQSDTGRSSNLLVRSRMNFRTKFRIRSLINKYERTLVAVMSIVVGGMIMSVGLMMNDSCIHYEDKVIDDIGTFEYQYVLKELSDEEHGGEEILSTTVEVKGNINNIVLMGLPEDETYLNLTMKNGKKADIDDGYYISSMAAAIFDVNIGDTITVSDTRTLEKYKIKIKGVVNNQAQSLIYSSREKVSELLDIDSDLHNIVLSDKKLDIDEGLVDKTIEKQTMKEMIQNVISGMKILIYLMVAFGAVICAVCVYLMVNMLVEENLVTISMLKVLGYRDREINKITINIYHVLVPIGIALSLLGGYYITMAYFDYSTASFQAQIDAYISYKGLAVFVGGIIAAYTASLALLSRKVKRINMSDSLKSNRE